MSAITTITNELNRRAEHHAIGRLQEIRRELKSHTRLPTRQIFYRKITFDTYAFHVGGRTELQFNVGFESVYGMEQLRHGVAFSLELNQTLPDIGVLIPKVARFNEFLRSHPDEFANLRMWHSMAGSRSTNYPPTPIPPEIIKPEVFIFLGNLQPLEQIDYDFILEDFDRLLPLYQYVEGNTAFPAVTELSGTFHFVPGCTVKPARTSASVPQRELDVGLRHNELQFALYRFLSSKYGTDAVATEQGNGAGVRMDVVLRRGDRYRFYEIKTASSARNCIRAALAQLLEYSFWPGVQEAERLIIVDEPMLDADANAFLSQLRNRFALPIYYQQLDMQNEHLLDEKLAQLEEAHS